VPDEQAEFIELKTGPPESPSLRGRKDEERAVLAGFQSRQRIRLRAHARALFGGATTEMHVRRLGSLADKRLDNFFRNITRSLDHHEAIPHLIMPRDRHQFARQPPGPGESLAADCSAPRAI